MKPSTSRGPSHRAGRPRNRQPPGPRSPSPPHASSVQPPSFDPGPLRPHCAAGAGSLVILTAGAVGPRMGKRTVKPVLPPLLPCCVGPVSSNPGVSPWPVPKTSVGNTPGDDAPATGRQRPVDPRILLAGGGRHRLVLRLEAATAGMSGRPSLPARRRYPNLSESGPGSRVEGRLMLRRSTMGAKAMAGRLLTASLILAASGEMKAQEPGTSGAPKAAPSEPKTARDPRASRRPTRGAAPSNIPPNPGRPRIGTPSTCSISRTGKSP